ncbi:kinase inhibitor, partial [Enterobacter hormaechei]
RDTFGGAAPPKGEKHVYILTLEWLVVDKIDVDEGASGAMVGFIVDFHSLGSASIRSMYS